MVWRMRDTFGPRWLLHAAQVSTELWRPRTGQPTNKLVGTISLQVWSSSRPARTTTHDDGDDEELHTPQAVHYYCWHPRRGTSLVDTRPSSSALLLWTALHVVRTVYNVVLAESVWWGFEFENSRPWWSSERTNEQDPCRGLRQELYAIPVALAYINIIALEQKWRWRSSSRVYCVHNQEGVWRMATKDDVMYSGECEECCL